MTCFTWQQGFNVCRLPNSNNNWNMCSQSFKYSLCGRPVNFYGFELIESLFSMSNPEEASLKVNFFFNDLPCQWICGSDIFVIRWNSCQTKVQYNPFLNYSYLLPSTLLPARPLSPSSSVDNFWGNCHAYQCLEYPCHSIHISMINIFIISCRNSGKSYPCNLRAIWLSHCVQ